MSAPGTREGPTVLAIDAATSVGSVAVLVGRTVRAERTVTMRGARDEVLMPAVADALAEAGVARTALDAVVCGGGPGSFTSLRIAAAIAKGLATALGVPLLAAPSLALAVPLTEGAGRWLVSLDALRGERYAALVDVAGDAHAPALAGYAYLGVVPAASLADLAREHGARATIDANATIPQARAVAALGLSFDGARAGPTGALGLAPVDLALWEPDYGRKAEAQVQWEATHRRALPADASGAVHADAAGPASGGGGGLA